MHDAPLSLLSAQPLKLIFTLLHITAALLPLSFIILAYCFLVLSFVYSENFKAEVKALHSLPGSRPCHKQKCNIGLPSPSSEISIWVLGCTAPSAHLTEFCKRLASQTLTCTLFHAASPLSFTQLSSLSGDPRAPCLVSTHSPVPTLRIWNSKLVAESLALI